MACTANTPLEKTLEADILTLRKRGHFYFALTRTPNNLEAELARLLSPD
jgi:hypothetical protein